MSENENDMEEMNECCPHCSGKHKDRDDKEKKDLMNVRTSFLVKGRVFNLATILFHSVSE